MLMTNHIDVAMIPDAQIEREIIAGITEMLRRAQLTVGSEQAHPSGSNTDSSDDIIKDGVKEIQELKVARDRLENLFSGYIA